jgi:hypothetical protein
MLMCFEHAPWRKTRSLHRPHSSRVPVGLLLANLCQRELLTGDTGRLFFTTSIAQGSHVDDS